MAHQWSASLTRKVRSGSEVGPGLSLVEPPTPARQRPSDRHRRSYRSSAIRRVAVRQLSVALDDKVAAAAATSAERRGLSLSAWLNDAPAGALAVEDGLAAVASGRPNTARSPTRNLGRPTRCWRPPVGEALPGTRRERHHLRRRRASRRRGESTRGMGAPCARIGARRAAGGSRGGPRAGMERRTATEPFPPSARLSRRGPR